MLIYHGCVILLHHQQTSSVELALVIAMVFNLSPKLALILHTEPAFFECL